MPTAILDQARVTEIFLDCLFKEDEDTSDHVLAEGVMSTVGFHLGRLEDYRAEIEALLEELPDTFKASSGGGWSFLNACEDKYGRLWTGDHQQVEWLMQLGLATGKVEYNLPRTFWSVMPGGMPYFVVK